MPKIITSHDVLEPLAVVAQAPRADGWSVPYLLPR